MPVSYHPADVAEFNELINGDKLVVVDFHATWCGPCKIISPKFEEFSNKYTDALFAKVDVDEVADVAEEVSVRAMPTFMFFKNGKKVHEIVGPNAAKLEAAIKSNL
ncbi:thioredoxine 2 [Endogone sp. FLAS-F59071]|nr:thioredoxine 2 [Endogone sp. FLAS-F59071]|eukprot:RUS18193.1 thioredoxine 2 [Endogone sp. FLAS-F59071]